MNRPLVAALLLAVALNGGVGAQTPARDPDAGTAAITGRVVRADTGQPLRQAQIRASAPGVPLARFATTDADGRFVIAMLPAGQWTLRASRGGYVTQTFSQRRGSLTPDPIEIAAGQRFTTADFALLRGGVIAGRLFDEFGDPVSGIRVHAMQSQLVEGFRRFTQTGISDLTDDTGAYRLFGMAPGDYYVAANVRGDGAVPADGDSSAYAPTYYPGTAAAAEAQLITVQGGDEQTANFALLAARTARVAGIALSAGGEPLGNGVIRLVPALDDGTRPLTITVLPDGTFTFVNVAPGSYFLEVQAGPGKANTETEVASLSLAVGNDDVTGVTIVTGRGSIITGTVRPDPAASAPLPRGIQLAARPMRGPGGTVRGARADASNTFRLQGLVGPYAFSAAGLPDSWVVKSFTLNGADVIDHIVDFSGTEQISQAQLVVTNRITELTGRVAQFPNGVRDSAVVVFPEDAARWTYPWRYLRTARSGPDGRFVISGLPPNDRYRAVAVDVLREGEGVDPSFLTAFRERGAGFSLAEGERRTIDLPLIER